MMFLGPVILLVHLLGPFVASEFTAIVETSSGPVQGVIEELPDFGENPSPIMEYAAFRAIRYAQAPVGMLRFKPAEPAERSTKVHISSMEATPCPQYDSNKYVIGQEDCLFLNVLTPVTHFTNMKPDELKAVMVWIHDGNFARGSGRTDLTNPQLLLRKDIVFVSMNYRLGALGFLSLNDREATGNQGLKDQNIALKWVQANIKSFGGDPEKVTIFGKGAGAASVGFHVLSEASKGLFHRAISMSGTPLSPLSCINQVEARRRGKKLSQLLRPLAVPFRKKKTKLQVLYEAPFQRLVKKARHIDEIAPFLPTVEDPEKATDVFLPQAPMDIYKSEEFNKVPHILGITRWDTFPYEKLINETSKIVIDHYYQIASIDFAAATPFIQVALEQQAQYMGVIINLDSTKNKILFSHPVAETRRILAKHNNEHPVYYYHMDLPIDSYEPVIEEKTNFYLNDLAYTGDRDCIFPAPKYYELSPNYAMMDKVSSMWTNFAKHGNPTPAEEDQNCGHLDWPDSRSSEKALQIDDKISIIQSSSVKDIATIKSGDKAYGIFFFS